MEIDIKVSTLSKHFGNVQAVNNLDLEVKKGEIFCLVGPNAAGKTTTIRMMLGILKADTGNIKVKNYNIPQEKKN